MLNIDKGSRVPIYEQLMAQLELLASLGEMLPGELLPSVRALSQELGVNPNTIQKAYAELERRGFCQTVPGKGRLLSPTAGGETPDRTSEAVAAFEQRARELLQGGVPLAALQAALQSAALTEEGGARA